jgi:hypothetical protein
MIGIQAMPLVNLRILYKNQVGKISSSSLRRLPFTAVSASVLGGYFQKQEEMSGCMLVLRGTGEMRG